MEGNFNDFDHSWSGPGTNLQKVIKMYLKTLFFSIVRYFKIILLLLFCAYFDSCDVRGTPNLTLKLFSFFQFNKMSFCWKISHPFPKANLCPIFDRVWARLKKKKKTREGGSQYGRYEAFLMFFCGSHFIRRTCATKPNIFTIWVLESWNWNLSTPILHSGHKV